MITCSVEPGCSLSSGGWGGGQPGALSPPPFASPRRIKHPNIVALDDIYESGTHLYLIMQL